MQYAQCVKLLRFVPYKSHITLHRGEKMAAYIYYLWMVLTSSFSMQNHHFLSFKEEKLILRLGILYTIFLLCPLKIKEWIIDIKWYILNIYTVWSNNKNCGFYGFSNIFIQQQKEHMIRLTTMIAEISLTKDIFYYPNINFNELFILQLSSSYIMY